MRSKQNKNIYTTALIFLIGQNSLMSFPKSLRVFRKDKPDILILMMIMTRVSPSL